MSAYEALLFLHVISVAFWLGAELLVEILVRRAERQGDPATMRRLFDEFTVDAGATAPAAQAVDAHVPVGGDSPQTTTTGTAEAHARRERGARTARTARNIRTGATIKVKATSVPAFRSS